MTKRIVLKNIKLSVDDIVYLKQEYTVSKYAVNGRWSGVLFLTKHGVNQP